VRTGSSKGARRSSCSACLWRPLGQPKRPRREKHGGQFVVERPAGRARLRPSVQWAASLTSASISRVRAAEFGLSLARTTSAKQVGLNVGACSSGRKKRPAGARAEKGPLQCARASTCGPRTLHCVPQTVCGAPAPLKWARTTLSGCKMILICINFAPTFFPLPAGQMGRECGPFAVVQVSAAYD